MSTAASNPKAAAPPPPPGRLWAGVRPYRLTVDQFLRMIEAGILAKRDRAVLIHGRLIPKTTKNDPRNFAVDAVAQALRDRVGAEYSVREKKSIQLGHTSRSEPDIMVLRGTRDDFRHREPTASDAALVVEVADSTLPEDRGLMANLYAAAGIPTYWIVNIPDRRVEVYTEPTAQRRKAHYARMTPFAADHSVPLVLDGADRGAIPVRDLLP